MIMYARALYRILYVRKIGHLNKKTKMFVIEARVLIGWYSLASQSERVSQSCFYVKVAYLSYGEYSFKVKWIGKVYFPTHVLFINTVIRGAHDNVRTCVIQ